MKRKVLPVLIVAVLIVVTGIFAIREFMGSRGTVVDADYVDYAEFIGLEEDQYAIILNDELLDERAIMVDGHLYLSKSEFVEAYINERFYWDEENSYYLYTTPNETLVIYTDENQYYRDGTEPVALDYTVVKTIEDTEYICWDFLKAYNEIESQVFDDNRRMVLRTVWDTVMYVSTKEDTVVQCSPEEDSKVYKIAERGEDVILLAEYEEWDFVGTEEGYMGYIAKGALNTPREEVLSKPSFDNVPQYTTQQLSDKVNLGFHQFFSSSIGESWLLEGGSEEGETPLLTRGHGVNVLVPTWFHFDDTDGTLNSLATRNYVETCHEYGVQVWGMITNEFFEGDNQYFDAEKTAEVLATRTQRSYIIEQLMNEARATGMDGINVDFEGIYESTADDFLQFLRELSVACRDYELTLSVDNYVPTYTAYYNRKEQGEIADYVIIMGYDETNESSNAPGSVASLGFVRDGIERTMEEVPASKLINTLPLYTRIWRYDSEGIWAPGETATVGIQSAMDYFELRTNVTFPAGFTWNETAGQYYASYENTETGNREECWMEDERSIEEKMKVIKEYDLAGVGVWKIDYNFSDEGWRIIQQYLE